MEKYKGLSIWIPGDIVTFLVEKKGENEDLIEVMRRELDLSPVEQKKVIAELLTHGRKYFFNEIEVGETKTIPWRSNKDGMPIDQRPIHNALVKYSKESGRQFQKTGHPYGLKVTRTK